MSHEAAQAAEPTPSVTEGAYEARSAAPTSAEGARLPVRDVHVNAVDLRDALPP